MWTEKQLASLSSKLAKAKPHQWDKLIKEAAEKTCADNKQAVFSRTFRLVAGGGVVAKNRDVGLALYENAMKGALTSIALARAFGPKVEPIPWVDVAEYLTTVDEEIFGQLPSFLGHTGTNLIAAGVFHDADAFVARLARFPASVRMAALTSLRIVGGDVALPDHFVAWLGRQYRTAFPAICLPLRSGWEGAREVDLHDAVDIVDPQVTRLTPSGKRFIEIFTSVDAWRTARGAGAQPRDISA